MGIELDLPCRRHPSLLVFGIVSLSFDVCAIGTHDDSVNDDVIVVFVNYILYIQFLSGENACPIFETYGYSVDNE